LELPYPETELPKRLTFAIVPRGGGLTLEVGNPTPCYATLGAVRVAIEGAPQTEPTDMIAPFSHAALELGALRGAPGERAKVQFMLLNDDGNPMGGERDVTIANPDNAPH
jgi:P pilus assembly chaperone PapD